MKISYDKLYDLLQMKPNKIFINDINENNIDIDKDIKILSIYILQIDLWTKHYNISENRNDINDNDVDTDKNILNFFESKKRIISKEINNQKMKEIFYKYIFDIYIYDYINYIYSIEQYNKAYIKINNFIKKSKIDGISNSIIYNIYKISKNYFFNYLQLLLNSQKEIIINYMLQYNILSFIIFILNKISMILDRILII